MSCSIFAHTWRTKDAEGRLSPSRCSPTHGSHGKKINTDGMRVNPRMELFTSTGRMVTSDPPLQNLEHQICFARSWRLSLVEEREADVQDLQVVRQNHDEECRKPSSPSKNRGNLCETRGLPDLDPGNLAFLCTMHSTHDMCSFFPWAFDIFFSAVWRGWRTTFFIFRRQTFVALVVTRWDDVVGYYLPMLKMCGVIDTLLSLFVSHLQQQPLQDFLKHTKYFGWAESWKDSTNGNAASRGYCGLAW